MKTGQITTVEKVINNEILKYWTYPVFNGGTKIVSVVSYARIITKQKKMEQELIQAEKLKGIGQLAAGVAHELNNPICSILGFTELIKESIGKTNPLNELLNDIIDSAKRSKQIVTGLLEYARQSVSNVGFHNIEGVIDRTISLVEHNLKIKGINVVRDNEENLPMIKIDSQKTTQVFVNIISNSIDALAKGGRLSITTQRENEKFVSVRFHDDGCGIPIENINQIFNPFFTTKEVGSGTGLGLSIAREIIEQQNGTIDVESEVGKWTEFKIAFPVIL